MSRLTAEEIELVWVDRDPDDDFELPSFNLKGFHQVNEQRKAKGKPTVTLGSALDADVGLPDVNKAASVFEGLSVEEISKSSCYEDLGMPDFFDLWGAMWKRREELRAERRAKLQG